MIAVSGNNRVEGETATLDDARVDGRLLSSDRSSGRVFPGPGDLLSRESAGLGDALLHRVAAGEADAVKACLDRYGPLVWSIALRMLRNKADAEDAVQEIFLELWQKASRFDPAFASEQTFIAMVARRRLIDRKRKMQRRHGHMQEFAASLPESMESPVADQAEISDEADRVRRVLDQLRDEEKQAIRLSVCEGLSHSAIAEQLKLPLGTVKSHVRRGLTRVRELLGAGGTSQGREVTS
ncbi:MAG: RNA polymerase sigma factor [Phycisphaerae bacterium]